MWSAADGVAADAGGARSVGSPRAAWLPSATQPDIAGAAAIGDRRADDDRSTAPPRPNRRWVQVAAGVAVVAAVALAYRFHDGFRFETNRALAVVASGDADAIGAYLRGYGVWAPIASLALMVVQAVSAPVPAVLIAFANGLAFGVVWGGLLTVAGQSLAAAVCFGIARSFGRGPVEALAGRAGFAAADRWFARWGARAVFVARLVPGVSFDLVSYAAGLTGMGFRPFLVATVAGVTPQALLYVVLIRASPRAAWALVVASWLAVGIASIAFARRAARSRAAMTEARDRASLPMAAVPADRIEPRPEGGADGATATIVDGSARAHRHVGLAGGSRRPSAAPDVRQPSQPDEILQHVRDDDVRAVDCGRDRRTPVGVAR